MKTAVVGGGAAGFFLAISLKERMPEMEVTIFERSSRVLAKVEVSGGGRCNCTNTFSGVHDLSAVYPRGHRLMKRLFNVFSPADAYAWFERHGVPLVAQDDGCVFPKAQDSHAVIGCFLALARQHHIAIRTRERVTSLEQLAGYDFVAVTTGGSPQADSLRWLADAGHELETPVPSLFTFSIADERLRTLMGTVVEAAVQLPGTKLRADGPLLVTHWGLSGPAILKLSSYAARHLADVDYRTPLRVRWVQAADTDVQALLQGQCACQPQKVLTTLNPFGLPQRLWAFLADRALAGRAQMRWGDMGKKDINRLANVLCNDVYDVAGRAPFKDEFVTCGGVSLKAVSAATLESRHVPGLYFAGEVLDVDGVTGGFNFQAAWTTAYTVAQAIADRCRRR